MIAFPPSSPVPQTGVDNRYTLIGFQSPSYSDDTPIRHTSLYIPRKLVPHLSIGETEIAGKDYKERIGFIKIFMQRERTSKIATLKKRLLENPGQGKKISLELLDIPIPEDFLLIEPPADGAKDRSWKVYSLIDPHVTSLSTDFTKILMTTYHHFTTKSLPKRLKRKGPFDYTDIIKVAYKRSIEQLVLGDSATLTTNSSSSTSQGSLAIERQFDGSRSLSICSSDITLYPEILKIMPHVFLPALTGFKDGMAELLNLYGNELSPNETFNLIFDSLSQAILKREIFDDERQPKIASEMLCLWQEVQFTLKQFLETSAQKQEKGAAAMITLTIKQLENFPNTIPCTLDPTIRQSLISIAQPLQSLFSIIKNKVPTNCFHDLVPHLNELLTTPISQTPGFKCSLETSPESLKRWLQFRISTLNTYLASSSIKNELIVQLTDQCEKISSFINQREWIFVYQAIVHLHNLINTFCEDSKKMDTLFPLPINQKNRFIVMRYQHFIQALLSDFQFFISHRKLISIVSREAATEMLKNHQTLLQLDSELPLSTCLDDWIKQLEGFEGLEFQGIIEQFQSSWNSLGSIVKNLQDNVMLNENLQDLGISIKKEDYYRLRTIYAQVAELLKDPLSNWNEELKRMSQCVEQIQFMLINILYDPRAPQADIDILKKGFTEYNELLLTVVKPISKFMSTFQQLFCVDRLSSSAFSKGGGNSMEQDNFGITLFNAAAADFQELEEYLGSLRAEYEASTHCVSSPSEPMPSSENKNQSTSGIDERASILSQLLKALFKSTKSRKIESKITKELKKLQISFRIEVGKGSHRKLYVGEIGKPIILPHPSEWKTGTQASIENDLLTQLLALMPRQELLSASSSSNSI